MARRTFFAFLVVLFLAGGLLLAEAAPGGAIRYVTPDGRCGGAAPCYASIQAAVDAASDGDIIKVARGTYTGAQTRVSATTGYTYTQVVLVDGKSLTLKGGFTASNWNLYKPQENPTIIDAQQHGRGVTLLGDGSQVVTVAGLQIVNGDYTNLGNADGVSHEGCPTTGGDCAGGLLAYRVKLFLLDALVRDNIASRLRSYSYGGGVLLWRTQDGTTLENTRIFRNSNIVYGYGGGVSVSYNKALTIRNCQFDQNSSSYNGGGLYVDGSEGPILIEDSRFVGNRVVGDSSTQGGGMFVSVGDAIRMNRVEFRDNWASEDGAAFYIRPVGLDPMNIQLTNILAAENQLQSPQKYGAAIRIGGYVGFNGQFKHFTVADNQAPAAILIAENSDGPSTHVQMTNMLIDDATYGLVGSSMSSGALKIDHVNTLFYHVTTQTAIDDGSPAINGVGTLTGNPKLDGNQRLQAGSAAIDAGVDSGVTLDLDKGVRPAGAGYDVGADEFSAAAPGALRFAQATYMVNEGRTIVIDVERVGGAAGAISVHYASSDGTAQAGSDYIAVSGTLHFADGETRKTFALRTLNDARQEVGETLVLSLSQPAGGAALGDPNQAVLIISDVAVTFLPMMLRRH